MKRFLLEVTFVALLVAAARGFAWSTSMTVYDPRPVAKAIEEIERTSGKAVTYEDPPYVYASTIVDVTKMISRGSPAAGSRTLIPKGGMLTFTLPAGRSSGAELSAVQSLVKTYNASGAATFSVWRDDKLTHVVPQRAIGPGGRLEAVTPVLDTRITLQPKPRTGLALLEEICQAVSAASGQRVEVGTVPVNALLNQQIAIGANYEQARSVLQKLIVANGAPLSWLLFNDPGSTDYALNLPIVPQPQ